METLNLIQYITQHPEFDTIVILGNDDMTPMDAIHYLIETFKLNNDYIWKTQVEPGNAMALLVWK